MQSFNQSMDTKIQQGQTMTPTSNTFCMALFRIWQRHLSTIIILPVLPISLSLEISSPLGF